MMIRPITSLQVPLFLAFVLGASTAGAATYKFVTIDYPGAYSTEVTGINDAGQASGFYYTAPGAHERAFLYSGGVFAPIDYPGAVATVLWGINANGQIVGQYYSCPSSYGCDHPFVYSGGVFTLLPEVPGSMAGTTVPFAINASGQIAGWYVDPCFCTAHGFFYSNGSYTTIDQPGFFTTTLVGLNDNGQIAGSSEQCWGGCQASAFTFQSGVTTPVGPLPSGSNIPWIGINNAGDIGGTYYAGGTAYAFVLSGGTYTSLDYPGAQQTVAEGQIINSSKQVGGFYFNGDGSAHGFIASPTYSVCLLYDPTKAAKSGSTIPIKLELCDGSGNDLSSSSLTVHAVSVTMVSTSISGAVEDSGDANPGNDFRYDSTLGTLGGYIFNLSTKGMSTGSYVVNFTVSGDSSSYTAAFQVK